MHGQYTLVQTILFFSTVALVSGSYCLSIRKPIVMLPCSLLALLSLGILIVFMVTQPIGAWFWAGVVYAGAYACFISLGWFMFARQSSRSWLLDRLGPET